MRAYSILPLFLAIAVTPAPLTQVVVYHPGSMHVTQTISGMCWESSIASARRDAFRCIIANIIHDPCFALDAQDVACPVDVVRDRGIVVRIASTPSTRANVGAPGATAPWTFILASGSLCALGTGTVISDFPYFCRGSLVCAQPASLGGDARRFWAECGKVVPASGASPPGVPAHRAYAVRTMWR